MIIIFFIALILDQLSKIIAYTNGWNISSESSNNGYNIVITLIIVLMLIRYISNDNTTWQEITDIVSGTPKELDVDGWNNLYLKIEANTSRIDNIDVAYYKD